MTAAARKAVDRHFELQEIEERRAADLEREEDAAIAADAYETPDAYMPARILKPEGMKT